MLRPTHAGTRGLLEELLSRRILVLDGAMGSMIYARGPQEEDYRGARFRNHPVPLKNCTEAFVLSNPRLIEDIHRAYLEAGADVIETDTFNANALSLAEFQLGPGAFLFRVVHCFFSSVVSLRTPGWLKPVPRSDVSSRQTNPIPSAGTRPEPPPLPFAVPIPGRTNAEVRLAGFSSWDSWAIQPSLAGKIPG